jgi:uncharacterized membrane protein
VGIKSILKVYSSNKLLVWSLVIAAIWYGLISFVNHYCFRTYSLDLGLYTNALYDYAHFQLNDSLTFKETTENLLSDHFDLYLPLLSPLSYLFGSYTLLLVQIISILFGAIGIYKLVEKWMPASKMKHYALLYFLFFFSNFTSLAFDYHSNIVASMFVPWLFLAFHNKEWKKAWLFLVVILIAKENMSLWMVFVTSGMVWIFRKDKSASRHALWMCFVAFIYFVLIFGFVMPLLSHSGKYAHFHYSILGTNVRESIVYLVTHPIESFRLLFINHQGDPLYDYVKAEVWIFIGVLGCLMIRKPVYLWMLIPIFGQKMYNDNPSMWGVQGQYTIEFAPILTIAVFDVIRTFNTEKLKKYTAIFMLLLSVVSAIRVMDNTYSYVEKARIRIYKKAHYNREFSIPKAYKVISKIPEGAAISAQSAFVPHVALRDTVYTFPHIGQANYILLSPVDNPYPITPEVFTHKTDSLLHDIHWETIYHSTEFILLKRKK